MDSRKLTFDSMECLSKTNYDKYHHFVVIDDTDEIDEQYVENEMKGVNIKNFFCTLLLYYYYYYIFINFFGHLFRLKPCL